MQVLTVIVPYCKSTSNFALSCGVLRAWLSNNGFAIKSSHGDLSFQNLDYYLAMSYPVGRICKQAIQNEDSNLVKLTLDRGYPLSEQTSNQRATALFYQLVLEAKQGHIEVDEDGYVDTFFEASLKITGKKNLEKISTDLGSVDEEILEFITEIQQSEDEEDYFELLIYFDDDFEDEPYYQLNLLVNGMEFNPIMLEKDHAIEIIKGLLDAGVIRMA